MCLFANSEHPLHVYSTHICAQEQTHTHKFQSVSLHIVLFTLHQQVCMLVWAWNWHWAWSLSKEREKCHKHKAASTVHVIFERKLLKLAQRERERGRARHSACWIERVYFDVSTLCNIYINQVLYIMHIHSYVSRIEGQTRIKMRLRRKWKLTMAAAATIVAAEKRL